MTLYVYYALQVSFSRRMSTDGFSVISIHMTLILCLTFLEVNVKKYFNVMCY